jgi:hypothetical protein
MESARQADRMIIDFMMVNGEDGVIVMIDNEVDD